ncbi:MAG: prepilin-type N-terminal cleavage/methylation domain-containing protein [Xanthomonadales bacterium]|nr:prepilin-type N-terminal cleavage/methylation domain-containing protein [Xanthomonadales bacterium]
MSALMSPPDFVVRTRTQRGFSLVEMMIALAVGLILTAAVISMTVNMSTTATASVRYSRLTQDMRTVASVISRELRRAGFNVAALNQVRTGQTADLYSRLLLDDADGDNVGSCITFGYDTLDLGTQDSTPGVISAAEPAEWRGFRRNVVNGVGVVEMRTAGAGVGGDCASGGHTWVALTDPAVLDVMALDFDMGNSGEAVAATVPDPANPAASVTALVGVRTVLVTLRARSRLDPANTRELRQWVRVRAETARLVP